ncbi:unnamed protein product [Schistosoma haematobium]|nr:unnamed protein product [Schistosoma haematobium]
MKRHLVVETVFRLKLFLTSKYIRKVYHKNISTKSSTQMLSSLCLRFLWTESGLSLKWLTLEALFLTVGQVCFQNRDL